jgi:4-hydroxybenzoate polyprenyltransferase
MSWRHDDGFVVTRSLHLGFEQVHCSLCRTDAPSMVGHRGEKWLLSRTRAWRLEIVKRNDAAQRSERGEADEGDPTTLARLAGLVGLARWPDWSTSKLPFLGAAALLLAPPQTPAIQILAILVTVLCWAAFGYCVNDVADRVADLQAGKANRAGNVSTATWGLFLALSATASLWLSLFWAPDVAAPALVLGGLLLASAYSLPPFRLKERGALGLAAGAASQWLIPVLAISAVQAGGWSRPAAWCVALLGLAIGTRWMAIHQLQDIEADRRAGVRTYASRGGRVWPVLLGAFMAEVVLLAATLAVTWPQSFPAAAALAFWIVQQSLLRPRGEPMRRKLQGYDHAPLAEYYFLLLPVTLALARGASSPAFLAIAAVFAALGWCYLRMMSGEWCEAWRERVRDP